MVLTWGDADFGLTRVHDPADDVRVAETTAAGFDSPKPTGRQAAKAAFVRRQHGDACSMAGPCGEPSGCRFPVGRSSNLTRFRHPVWKRGAET